MQRNWRFICGTAGLLIVARMNRRLDNTDVMKSIKQTWRACADNVKQMLARRRIVRCIMRGCDESMFEQLRCPTCGGKIELIVHDNVEVLTITCSDEVHHMHYQASCPQTRPARGGRSRARS